MKSAAVIRKRLEEAFASLKDPKYDWAAYMDEAEVLRAEIDALSWTLSDAPQLNGSPQQSPAAQATHEEPQMSEGNSNIQVEITDPHEFHCFRLILNPKGHEIACPAAMISEAPCSCRAEGRGTRLEIMLHGRSLVDLINKCSLALCDWQSQTTKHLIDLLSETRVVPQRGGLPTAADFAPEPCKRCAGCGKIADTERGEPWTAWTSLPLTSQAAVIAGIVKPMPCPACAGTGKSAIGSPVQPQQGGAPSAGGGGASDT